MWNIFVLSHKLLVSLVILCVCPGVGLSFVSHPWVPGKTSTRRTGNSNTIVCFLLKHDCSRCTWNKHLAKSGTNQQTQNAAGVNFCWFFFFVFCPRTVVFYLSTFLWTPVTSGFPQQPGHHLRSRRRTGQGQTCICKRAATYKTGPECD